MRVLSELETRSLNGKQESMKFIFQSGLLALLLCGTAFAADTQPNRFVSNNACRTCHPAVWNAFYRNPHFKTTAAENEAPERAGCQGCHGPGGNHLDNKGGKSTIVAFSALPGDRIVEACLRCHGQTISRANVRNSQHTLNGMACTSCHSVHRSQSARALLQKPQTALCEECHTDVRAQFAMPYKHRVEEGVMSCADCHNPHGSFAPTWRMGFRPHNIDQVAANQEPCLKCHADKRGPFIFEHAVARVDGCESCHAPHGSTNSRLLLRPVVFTLCLECHNGSDNFGRRRNGIPTQTPSHNMADPRYQNCTSCHVRIHGSNADSNFLR
jgi:DmsE family decaheme c-type cytochrome